MALRREKIYIPRPYIGVTGIKTVKELQSLSEICLNDGGLFGHPKDKLWPHIEHIPMYGFICTNKRLADPLTGGTQSPPLQDLQTLTRLTPNGAIPMIHYFTTNRDKLADEIKSLFDGPYRIYESCQALQINMDWPDQGQISDIRKAFPEMQIVLQIPQKAMKGLSHFEIIERCRNYQHLVQYVLVDPSAGEGIEFSMKEYSILLRELCEKITGRNVILGIAGGFDGNNVFERIVKIALNLGTSYFCVDAQGKLRTSDKQALDFLLTQEYISQAAGGIRQADHDVFYSENKV
ncbi:hypothetical protein HYT51_00465 [Candidatus Woesearchaeota archaeon]|nr:hypothetical protein [Candidatus Woesearchaeota archaeon]